MRRWFAALAMSAALAGCSGGLPDGADGDLTNHWDAPQRAQSWRPLTGWCFDDEQSTARPDNYAPISCDERHLTQTFYVGDLKGAAAKSTANRGTPSPASVAAYQDCSRRADTYVHGRWRTGWLAIRPVLPDLAGWEGGARWFRCDIGEADLDGELVARTGSLYSALDQSYFRMECFNPKVKDDRVTDMPDVDCARPHHAEFAGLWTAPKMSVDKLHNNSLLRKGCLSTIAHYAKVPDDSNMRYRTGWMGFPGSDLAWQAGDRTVQCFLWISSETMTGSYRGAGPKKLHVHYA